MITCTNCGRPFPDEGTPFRCQRCGGFFDYESPLNYDPELVDESLPGIWKYRNTFSALEDCEPVSLEEGNTPLVWEDICGLKVGMKCEYLNPSGSFKDRGSSLITSFLRSRNVSDCIEDSSGNAGVSLAAYTARAAIDLAVYVPEVTSEMKKRLITKYGAEMITVDGTRTEVLQVAKNVAETGITYASHAYLPFNLPGYATVAYEIVDQMEGRTPEAIILPVGQGGLLLGMYRGFIAMEIAGIIDNIPKFIGVQARACAPLWSLFNGGIDGLRFATDNPTLAEGVRVWHPVRGDDVLKAVGSSNGLFAAVDEDEITKGVRELAGYAYNVEPTSALVWSALRQYKDSLKGPVIMILTGSAAKNKTITT